MTMNTAVGFGLNETVGHLIDTLPQQVWTPTYDANREPVKTRTSPNLPAPN